MHIGVNAHLLSRAESYRAAGVSNYIDQLLQSLSAVDSRNRYTVFTGRGACPQPPGRQSLGANFAVRASRLSTQSPPLRLLWEQTAQALRARHLDVLHCPVNVVPLLTRVPRVVTIHDLTFMISRDFHLPARGRYLRLMTGLSARLSEFVVTDSENTRRDVIRLLNVPPARVVAVPLAAGPEYCWLGGSPERERAIRGFRERKGLPELFFLYVGTLEPRKNVPCLLRAYAEFRRRAGGGCDLPKLVIAGGKGWMYEEIFRLARALRLDSHVIFPGFVPRDEIVWWYNAALGFVYLSAYEGFGLPPLQAMACGVPVIAGNGSSLPEVAGDAARLVDPQDTAAVAAELQALAASPELRAELRLRGLERAGQFSWRRTAERTLAVYAAAARGDRGGCAT